eukprot:389360-Pyramimonas_sp.AAC.1
MSAPRHTRAPTGTVGEASYRGKKHVMSVPKLVHRAIRVRPLRHLVELSPWGHNTHERCPTAA